MSADPHAITNTDELRAIVGEPLDLVTQKVF